MIFLLLMAASSAIESFNWSHLLLFLLGCISAHMVRSVFPDILRCFPAVLNMTRKQVTKVITSSNEQPLSRIEVEHEYGLSTWQRQAYNSFTEVLLAKSPVDFPCIYATKGFRAKEHLYVFVDSDDLSEARHVQAIAFALREYIPESRTLGPNTSLVILTPRTTPIRSVDEYNSIYWKLLKGLAELDSKDWPSGIPQAIDTPRWCFCFDSEPLFAAALTPAHHNRRSRHAPCFSIVFQPKWVFDILFATPVKKQGAIGKVRKLLEEYDEIDTSPELKSYGDETGRESKQYYLLDENMPAPCPYDRLR